MDQHHEIFRTLFVAFLILFLNLTVIANSNKLYRKTDMDLNQSGNNTTLIDRWAKGPSHAIFPIGDIIYIGSGPTMMITNFNDQNSPELIGEYITCGYYIHDIKIVDNLAYIALGDSGVSIVGISNPSFPAKVGHFRSPGWATEIVISGNYAYITEQAKNLRIINISDPSNPVGVGYYEYGGYLKDIALVGDYICFVASGKFCMINVSDPSNPYLSWSYFTYGDAEGLSISNGYAFIADGLNGLLIIDISDPSNPSVVNRFEIPGKWIYDVDVKGNYAYIEVKCHPDVSFSIVDISDLTNPFLISDCKLPDLAEEFMVFGNYAYILNDEYGLIIIDITNSSDPYETSTYITPSFIVGIAIKGEYLYLANSYSGLRIIDLIDLSEVSNINTPGNARNIVIEGNYAYVADRSGDLRIIDISDPYSSTEIGAYANLSSAECVAVKEDYAYIIDYSVLRTINISDFSHIFETGWLTLNDFPKDIEVHGDYLYIVDGKFGLRILSLSDPSNPYEIGNYDTPSYASSVSVIGNYAYVAESYEWPNIDQTGLSIIDISDPNNPHEIGYCETPGSAVSISIDGDYAYIADQTTGLRILDISDVSNPFEIGYYDLPNGAWSVNNVGPYAYVYSSGFGLYVIHNDLYKTPISVNIDEISSFAGDTLLLPIEISFPVDSSYCSTELILSGFQHNIDFIEIETDSCLIGDSNWMIQYNCTDSLLYIAAAGAEDITGNGILFQLKFFIPDNTDIGFIPITIESAVFNSGNNIKINNGGIHVFQYGDVDMNNDVNYDDAILILDKLIGNSELNENQISCADVSLNGTASALDASLILQYKSGLINSLPVDTTEGTFQASGNFSMTNQEFNPNDVIEVPIELREGENILSFEGQFSYNPEHLILQSIECPVFLNNSYFKTNDQSGQILFAGAKSEALNEEDIFCILRFIVQDEFTNTETIVSFDKIRLNENALQIDIAVSILIKQVLIEPENSDLPFEYSLTQNYPNPFNPTTTIAYNLPRSSYVNLSIYDINGRLVETLVNEREDAGYYSVNWNVENISSGIYIYRIDAGEFCSVKKCLVVK